MRQPSLVFKGEISMEKKELISLNGNDTFRDENHAALIAPETPAMTVYNNTCECKLQFRIGSTEDRRIKMELGISISGILPLPFDFF